MAQLNPYLGFSRNCKEAMTFYKGCFGGELSMQSVGESPMGAQTPPENKDLVMHSILKSGNVMFMASDMAMMGPETAVKPGNNITMCINGDTEKELKSIFSKLSQGGTNIKELKEEFWGGVYGEITDKYGIRWMFNFQKKPLAEMPKV